MYRDKKSQARIGERREDSLRGHRQYGNVAVGGIDDPGTSRSIGRKGDKNKKQDIYGLLYCAIASLYIVKLLRVQAVGLHPTWVALHIGPSLEFSYL